MATYTERMINTPTWLEVSKQVQKILDKYQIEKLNDLDRIAAQIYTILDENLEVLQARVKIDEQTFFISTCSFYVNFVQEPCGILIKDHNFVKVLHVRV